MAVIYKERTFKEEEITGQFLAAMKRAGVVPRDENMRFEIDNQLHRFQVADDRGSELSGCYKLYDNGAIPAGYFQDWRSGVKENWKFDTRGMSFQPQRRLSKTEYAKYKKQQEAERAERERKVQEARRKQDEAYKQAKIKAFELFKTLPVMTDGGSNPYLKAKKRNVSNLLEYQPELLKPRTHNGTLFFPLFNAGTGEFQSLQRIYLDKDGEAHKPFAKGTKTTGACYLIRRIEEYVMPDDAIEPVEGQPYEPTIRKNPNYNITLVCEGIFTALAVWETLGDPHGCLGVGGLFDVVACMSCGNMEAVCTGLKKRAPNTKVIIMADNDFLNAKKTGRNAGLEAAKNAVAKGLALTYLAPNFETEYNESGSDWEDYFNIQRQYTNYWNTALNLTKRILKISNQKGTNKSC